MFFFVVDFITLYPHLDFKVDVDHNCRHLHIQSSMRREVTGQTCTSGTKNIFFSIIDTVNFSQISVVASIFFWNRNCFASSRILFINLFVAHNRLAQGAIRSRGPTTGALHRLLFDRLLFHRPRPHLTTSDSPPPALPRPETALYDTLWIDFQVQSAPLHPFHCNQFFSQKKEHWGQLSTIISLQKEKSGCYSIG